MELFSAIFKKSDEIQKSVDKFKNIYFSECNKKDLNVFEITEDILNSVINKFFEIDNYSEAYLYLCTFANDYIKGEYNDIDKSVGFDIYSTSPEYIAWNRKNDINAVIYRAVNNSKILDSWVTIHGKAHTEEEAATIAANKWGELLFSFHLQDNGALNEEHSFAASMLATSLGDDVKNKISNEVKEKTLNLLKDYYKHYINYQKLDCYKQEEILNWCRKTLPDPKGNFKWSFMSNPACDYDANYCLYLILLHGGVDEKYIHLICPWKTNISIRPIDNAVFYQTYSNRKEL